jgi:hypothetical protein
MTKIFTKTAIFILLMASVFSLRAQSTDSFMIAHQDLDHPENTPRPRGTLWGYAFGDYAFKGSGDDVTQKNGVKGRGGSNQYTGMAAQASQFQFRRIYLGYNYDISKKFSAEFLLAAEDDYAPSANFSTNTGIGDVLQSGKFSPYVKLANIRWKNIYPGADVVMGNVATPAFPLLSEVVWGYRSLERTVSDIRRTPSFDQGISIQGRFDHIHGSMSEANFGYNLMMGNGTSAKPETDMFKWFYGDVWGKFLNKRLIVDIYQDYDRIAWNPMVTGLSGAYHADRNMTKIFVAYQVPKFTVGVEAFQNTILGGVALTGTDKKTYYRTLMATDFSVFARGRIYKNYLGFVVRYDNYDPSGNNSEFNGSTLYTSYSATVGQYDPGTKEQFFLAGLDYTPVPNVHIMPNVWINTYETTLNTSSYSLNTDDGTNVKGTDAVYRLTFYYLFGKKEGVKF